MKRRGNKSTKVPNVKLRPAQPGASTSKKYLEPHRDSGLDLEEGDIVHVVDSQVDSSRYYDPTPRPFTAVVLCATGIGDKPGIFKQAVELGATTTSDFTDRVTHLIAAGHGGAKYMVRAN